MTNSDKFFTHIVEPFLSFNDTNSMYIGSYYTSNGMIYINDEICFKNTNKGIIFEKINVASSIVTILNLLPETKAVIKNNSIFINGIEWDGKKANLNLFS